MGKIPHIIVGKITHFLGVLGYFDPSFLEIAEFPACYHPDTNQDGLTGEPFRFTLVAYLGNTEV